VYEQAPSIITLRNAALTVEPDIREGSASHPACPVEEWPNDRLNKCLGMDAFFKQKFVRSANLRYIASSWDNDVRGECKRGQPLLPRTVLHNDRESR
jgi:hypothetical protein